MNKLQQFYVLSLGYERLANNGYRLRLSLDEAFENEEVIALADNNCLRAIRRIVGREFDRSALLTLLGEKRALVKGKVEDSGSAVRDIIGEIRNLLFIPEFVSVTFPSSIKAKEYNKFNEDGFELNGERYIWLLCGAGHQRTNRAMYCSERIYKELNQVLACGIKNDNIQARVKR